MTARTTLLFARHIAQFLVLGALLALSLSARAAIFTASASACGGDYDTQTDAAALAQVVQISCTGTHYGNAAAIAASSGLGASADFTHFCCQTAGGAGSWARVETQVLISGPAGSTDPVLVSLNLVLKGGLSGNTTEDYNRRAIGMDVAIGYVGSFYGEMWTLSDSSGITSGSRGPLAPSGTNCYFGCDITSPEFWIRTNTPLDFRMLLTAEVGTGTGTSYGAASAYDTFYFPLSGPVFNLPAGYDATIYGMNVEGNRVVGVTTVPEPSSAGTVALGLLLMALLRRRARRL